MFEFIKNVFRSFLIRIGIIKKKPFIEFLGAYHVPRKTMTEFNETVRQGYQDPNVFLNTIAKPCKKCLNVELKIGEGGIIDKNLQTTASPEEKVLEQSDILDIMKNTGHLVDGSVHSRDIRSRQMPLVNGVPQ